MTKVLVTYASEHGATAQIAQTIAKVLRQFNLEVTAKRMESVESLAEYEALVIGSAIYLGDWLPEAHQFLEKYQSQLAKIPLWLFSSGPTGSDDPLKLLNGELIPLSIEQAINALQPREIRVFHGKIDLRRLPPKDREIIKAAGVPRGDYRDWEEIKRWATEVSRALTVHALVVE